MLFHVYDDPKPEGYYVNEPSGIYRTVLDADWLLYILLPFLLVIAIAALMLAWHLHEIPKHKAEKKNLRQAELVSALTLLGLLEHWVWAVALFIAFMDWEAVDAWLLNLVQRARLQPAGGSPAELLSAGPADVTPPLPAAVERTEPALAAPVAAVGGEEKPA